MCSVWEAYKKDMAGYSLFGQELPSLSTEVGKQEARETKMKEEEEEEEGGKEKFLELENIDLIITEDTESKAKVSQITHTHTHTHTCTHTHTHRVDTYGTYVCTYCTVHNPIPCTVVYMQYTIYHVQ